MDQHSYADYNNVRRFASSDRSDDRRSSYHHSSNDRAPRSSSSYHPYAQRNGYNDRRSDGYSDRGRGSYRNGYESNRGRGYGNNRGRGSGPGTGKARDDDSKTEPLPSTESKIVPLSELQRYPVLFKSHMMAQVNGYEITAKNGKNVYQYDIQWNGITKKGKDVNLNTQTKAAHRLQLKQVALFTVFDQLLRDNKEFFGYDEKDAELVFDTGSIFFAHRKLLEKGETHELEIKIDGFAQEAKDYYKDIENATAVISLAGEINISALNGDLMNDRPIIQYLELAFSQDQRKRLFYSGAYYCFGNEFFKKDSAEVVYQTPFVLKTGCIRSIRLIGEPADKKLLIHLIPKKTAFYGTKSLVELIEHTIKIKVTDIWNRNNLQLANDAIKNLTVCTKHMENNRSFVASGLSKYSAKQQTFEIDGKDVTVADYFYKTYNKRLRDPDLPCVVERGTNYYPLEVLEIAEVQKIPKAKQNKFLASKITNQCCFDPAHSVVAIEEQCEYAEIRMSNNYIKNTGCRVDARHLLTVPAKQLYPPTIVFKDTQKTLNSGLFGMQVGDKFFEPACVQKLAFVLASRYLHEDPANNFVDEFLKRLKLYGVEIKEYRICKWKNGGKDYERLMDFAKDGYDYVFAIAGGINWSLASDSAHIKEYGNVDLLKSMMNNTMFFGIDLSHPFGSNDPTCVGFASNLNSTSSCMLKGDFGYQSPRETLVDKKLLSSKFIDAVKAYYRNSGQYPSWIVVYRAGLSEGEIQKVQEQEISVLKSAIDELQKNNAEFYQLAVKLTFVMINEKTNYRLFKEKINENDKAPAQNLPPGTCVSEVGQNRIPSFILISQRPLKGTARPTVYCVLEGADVVPLPHLEWLTYCLCYSNTNNTPTSICGPLDSASDLSKRARNNLKQWKAQKVDHNAVDKIFWSEDDKNDEKGDGYLDMLNQKLKAGILEDRFWA
uniref:Piwi domain-containing protein n=1 Tax=Panagrolaimus superbus TaxID=310955 RepID=A0A914ZBK9_9BILA